MLRTAAPPDRRLVLLGPLLTLAACATVGGGAPEGSAFWPLPPEKPRVIYVRTLRGPEDLPPGGFVERLRRVFAGSDSTLRTVNPTALALSPDERVLYVSLSSTGRILAFDFAKGSVSNFVRDVSGGPKQPFGLATDENGNVFVADEVGQVVLVLSPHGQILREIGRGLLKRPTGLAVDRKGQLLYVAEGGRQNDDRHDVQVFALDGRHLRTIGKRGEAPGEFNFPSYLTVSPSGVLYVADTLNFRIQRFDREGNLLGYFGTASAGAGGFNKIKGMAFDGAGYLHVADGANAIVQIFNDRDQLMLPYGGLAAPVQYMVTPTGVAIDSHNNIYIADLVNNRVNQYRLIDTSTESPAANAVKGDAAPAPKPAQ